MPTTCARSRSQPPRPRGLEVLGQGLHVVGADCGVRPNAGAVAEECTGVRRGQDERGEPWRQPGREGGPTGRAVGEHQVTDLAPGLPWAYQLEMLGVRQDNVTAQSAHTGQSIGAHRTSSVRDSDGSRCAKGGTLCGRLALSIFTT